MTEKEEIKAKISKIIGLAEEKQERVWMKSLEQKLSAEGMYISQPTLKRYVEELEKKGVVEIQRMPNITFLTRKLTKK